MQVASYKTILVIALVAIVLFCLWRLVGALKKTENQNTNTPVVNKVDGWQLDGVVVNFETPAIPYYINTGGSLLGDTVSVTYLIDRQATPDKIVESSFVTFTVKKVPHITEQDGAKRVKNKNGLYFPEWRDGLVGTSVTITNGIDDFLLTLPNTDDFTVDTIKKVYDAIADTFKVQ